MWTNSKCSTTLSNIEQSVQNVLQAHKKSEPSFGAIFPSPIKYSCQLEEKLPQANSYDYSTLNKQLDSRNNIKRMTDLIRSVFRNYRKRIRKLKHFPIKNIKALLVEQQNLNSNELSGTKFLFYPSIFSNMWSSTQH